MLFYNSSLPCIAVSYDTAIYSDVKNFMETTDKVDLIRMHPDDFLAAQTLPFQYINLVHRSGEERQAISDKLDALDAKRFSYAHPQAFFNAQEISPGSVIYPLAALQYQAKISTDVILTHNSVIAHYATVGRGTFISALVCVGGSAVVGEFCWLAMGTIIRDGIDVHDHVRTGIGTIIRKPIAESGTFVTENNIVKLR